jgi:Domain of unknown function (DUF1707)
MPSDDPQLRASDDDRDRTASLLREHHAAGRLTVDEFQERLDATYAAKTLGQLQELLADLPSIDLYRLPEQDMRRSQHEQASQPAEREHGRLSRHWRAAWGSWASVSMLLMVIWLIGVASSGFHNMQGLWFLWVAGPWGAILLSRWLFGQHPSGGGGPGRLPGGQAPGQAPGLQPPAPGERQDFPLPGSTDHRQQRMEDHLQRRQERLQRHQEHLQRRQEHLRRQQDQQP